MTERILLVICIAICLHVVGCGPQTVPVNNDNMVPRLDYSAFSPMGKDLSLARVKGTTDLPEDENLHVTPEIFQNALTVALRKSSMFEKVTLEPGGDYLLKVKIISQKVIYGVTANSLLYVRYKLFDNKGDKVIWEDKVLSQYDTYGGELTYAVEATVRKNITQFIQKLSTFAAENQSQ